MMAGENAPSGAPDGVSAGPHSGYRRRYKPVRKQLCSARRSFQREYEGSDIVTAGY